MRIFAVTLLLLAALGAAGAVFAAEPAKGRYTMIPTDGGFIRMDTQSGVLSFCGKKSGSLACEVVPDDKVAMQRQIDQLKKDNKDLKEENSRLEELVFSDAKKGDKSGGKFKLPTEKDIDNALGYVEQLYKKFRDKLRELDQKNEGGKSTPL